MATQKVQIQINGLVSFDYELSTCASGVSVCVVCVSVYVVRVLGF